MIKTDQESNIPDVKLQFRAELLHQLGYSLDLSCHLLLIRKQIPRFTKPDRHGIRDS